MRNKVYEQKLLKNRFWYRSEVIYEPCVTFFLEKLEKMQKNASGIKIKLNLDPKMIVLPNFLIISIPHTREYICAKLGVI